jgi:twitching motility protein PilT
MTASQEKIQAIVDTALEKRASDIHLSAGRKPIMRIQDELAIQDEFATFDTDGLNQLLNTILSEDEMRRFRRERTLDFSFSLGDKARFRCNAFFKRGVPAAAMRLIPSRIRNLKELGLPQSLARFAKKEQGFFLVVGPVGQGKSTTLAALIDIINENRTEHIITIEDPIEYLHEEKQSIVDQREVRIDTPDFGSALHSVFRQDVDVLMVGEMRGKETMSTAVTAGETGHLVFSTLHTNDAAQTINRIIDTFPAEQQDQIRTQLASSLSGILSQRLVSSKDGGRIPAYELLVNNKAVANLIREGRTHEIDSVIETSSDDGMITMSRSLANLVKADKVDVDEALQWSKNPRALERLL